MTFREWIESKGFTQTEIAKQLGVTRHHLNKLINFHCHPRLLLAHRMVNMTEGAVTLADIYKL